ncbi:MAG TPA: YXWGXW repeat-containing protein [Casimicrobiaceae bacterium]|nr:YXWGXW repeat-containing protein [Casimicrobiaceae bacterium]
MNLHIRKLAAASLLAAGTVAAPQLSTAAIDIEVGIGPPPPRYEVVPAPRPGYVWGQGYWGWDGHKHVWHSGHWMKEHHGEHWVAENWEHRGDHWYFHGGHWDRN